MSEGYEASEPLLPKTFLVEFNAIRENMSTKLFVGNLSFKLTEADMENLFVQHGKVISVAIPTDRDSGRKRGFAFVEMETKDEAEAAIQHLNGKDVDGRQLAVNLATPKPKSF
jgi:RNA recognition motif-containing protein